jgi:hypothetical protein
MTEISSSFSEKNDINELLESLPPHPRPFYAWTEREERNFRFQGDPADIMQRLKHKVYSLWFLIGEILTNPTIDEYVRRVPADETSDLYQGKAYLVHLVDLISKILTNTDLLEELLPEFSKSDDLKK